MQIFLGNFQIYFWLNWKQNRAKIFKNIFDILLENLFPIGENVTASGDSYTVVFLAGCLAKLYFIIPWLLMKFFNSFRIRALNSYGQNFGTTMQSASPSWIWSLRGAWLHDFPDCWWNPLTFPEFSGRKPSMSSVEHTGWSKSSVPNLKPLGLFPFAHFQVKMVLLKFWRPPKVVRYDQLTEESSPNFKSLISIGPRLADRKAIFISKTIWQHPKVHSELFLTTPA